MDHAYIREHSLIERYHRGLLEPELEARFEEHFVGCPECTEELALAAAFAHGMKAHAAALAQETARGALALGLFAWLARRGRLAQAGIALALLVLAVGPAAWLALRGKRTAGTLAAYRQQIADLDRETRALAERVKASAAAQERLAAQVAAQASAPRPAGWSAPVFNTPVLLLHTFRDEPGKAAATLDLGRQPGPASLAVDAPADPRFASYRVRLTGPGGRVVFAQGALRPNALDAILLTFPPGFFTAGDYRLTVWGVAAGGQATELASHPFRVVGPR